MFLYLPKTQGTYETQNFVNLMPKPDPKSPARLTALFQQTFEIVGSNKSNDQYKKVGSSKDGLASGAHPILQHPEIPSPNTEQKRKESFSTRQLLYQKKSSLYWEVFFSRN